MSTTQKKTRAERDKAIEDELSYIGYKLVRQELGLHMWYYVYNDKGKIHAQGSLATIEVICGLKTAQEYSDETYCKVRSDPWE